MNQSNLTRRRVVVATAAFSGAAAIGLESRWSPVRRDCAESAGQSGAGVRAAMLRMARLLYPHDALSDAVYAGVLDRALSAVAAGTEFGNQLDQAAAALDARAGGPWLELEPAGQVAATRVIETEAIFRRDPERGALESMTIGHSGSMSAMQVRRKTSEGTSIAVRRNSTGCRRKRHDAAVQA